jgi:hypothetical protein
VPWTSGVPDFGSPAGDVIYDPKYTDGLWVAVSSQPLAGKSGAKWVDNLIGSIVANSDCGPAHEPVTVDGAQGQICWPVVAVPSGGRGYVIWLYTSGDVPGADQLYGQAWFQQVLATVKLRPGEAVDTPGSAAP